ncbi:class I SAM-dependent methyltransferase [Micromonospora peucetia]|uniref:Methyltransferase domain-containing protein n=1 Tax=Micromonospora peucetia TaxID=47871 RepID=A0A1C6W4T8_9ACTN|nr:class I SAM-dependent methyltransferase [Micromonospora peucetia]SCL73589.1 Methyltransferase domain-containing protein [Micromonospora peucetia]
MTNAPVAAVDGRYTFDNATSEAARQVRLLAEILDPHSTDVLARTGVESGWRCLDLGTGAGSVATWLAEQVSPAGRVVALDADPRHVPTHELIDVRTGDVTTIDLGEREYDLVHARLLLMHLADREQVLRRAAAALKPGGVLVISEWDCTRLDEMLLRGPAVLAEAFLAFQNALVGLAVDNGASANWAHRVPVAMRDVGLVDVEAEVHNRLWSGGEAGCLLHASNSRQMEAALLARGMSSPQLETLRDGMNDPHALTWSYPMVTTVGRRAED